ncbi:MAG: hypothetical protein CBC25_07140 [Pelagibacteraceae bacterium TMED65]|nr:MAG: hypothetical protein CBC25_07140 [Pelagibacteraceae bacterium TMED65]
MKKFVHLFNKSNRKSIIIFIILNIILVFVETFSIALIPLAIDLIVSENPLIYKYFDFNNYGLIEMEQKEILVFGSIFFILLFVLKNIYVLGIVTFQETLYKRFSLQLKEKFYSLYINAPLEIINNYNSSQILRNTDSETTEYLNNFFFILKTAKDLFLFISIFILLLFADFKSTIIAILFLIFFLIVYVFVFFKKLRKLGENRMKAKNYFIKWLMQSLSSLKNIKISKRENVTITKFNQIVDMFEDARKKINIIKVVPNSLFEVAFVIVLFFSIFIISVSEIKNILPIVSLYVVSFLRLLPIFSRFGTTISALRTSYPSVLHLNSEFLSLEKYKSEERKNFNKDEIIKFEKNIEIAKVSFKYLNHKKEIFNDLNLSIEKGKAIGFVGKSGSGKTTLVNLLCGLIYPSSGEIKSDGVNIQNNLDKWQKKIGLVPQENYLLDDTILNNITFLNDEKKIDEKKLQDALHYSGASEIIKDQDNGIDTIVGERGSFLSGGQVQRIALARLLYEDPEILILDEFTNSLDPENEDFILKQLQLLKKDQNKNLIIITHKIKPLKICDEIIVMDQGKILTKYNFEDFYKKYGVIYD